MSQKKIIVTIGAIVLFGAALVFYAGMEWMCQQNPLCTMIYSSVFVTLILVMILLVVLGGVWSIKEELIPWVRSEISLGDAFVTKLNATGNGLIFGSYLGGSHEEWGYAIALGPGNDIYVTGETRSTNFPNIGAYQDTKIGVTDVFVTRMNTAGTTTVIPPDNLILIVIGGIGGVVVIVVIIVIRKAKP